MSHRPNNSSEHVIAMKICCQFVIFGPGKLRKRCLKVLEFFWAHGVWTLNVTYAQRSGNGDQHSNEKCTYGTGWKSRPIQASKYSVQWWDRIQDSLVHSPAMGSILSQKVGGMIPGFKPRWHKKQWISLSIAQCLPNYVSRKWRHIKNYWIRVKKSGGGKTWFAPQKYRSWGTCHQIAPMSPH